MIEETRNSTASLHYRRCWGCIAIAFTNRHVSMFTAALCRYDVFLTFFALFKQVKHRKKQVQQEVAITSHRPSYWQI